MVRPAGAPTTGPVRAAPIPDDAQGGGATIIEVRTGGGAPPVRPDAESARVAEARVRADPLAQQHQLRIQAKLDKSVDPETATRVVRFGHRVAHAIYDKGSALAKNGAEAIQGASQLAGTGRMVTTGTIEKVGDRFVYKPEPTDRLVVPAEGGGTRSFEFDKIEGDTSSIDAFFRGDHDFSFTVTEGDGTDLAVTTKKKGREHDVTVRGTVAYEGEKFEADIRYHGNETHESDSTGSTYTSTATYSGTVKGDGMELTVKETQRYQQVHAVRTEGLGGSAVAQTREIDNTLKVGDDTYRWNGVRTHATFRNGRANNANREWGASGKLFLNDELLGTYRLGSTDNILAFELDIGGERVEIDRFPRR